MLICWPCLLEAQTCDISGADTVCLEDVSAYHLTVSSPVAYNVVWTVSSQGTLMGYDNGMAVVHWTNSGTALLHATLVAPSTMAVIGGCDYTINVLPALNPMIVPAYLPASGNCLPGTKETAVGYCAGSQVTFYPNGYGGTYEWSITGNFTDTSFTGNNLNVSLGGAGTINVCLTETNAAGCSETVCKVYTIFAPPSVSFNEFSHGTADTISVCKGEELLFHGTFSDPNGYLPDTWHWLVTPAGGGSPVGAGATQDFTFPFTTAGDYWVTLYATNCLGCGSAPDSMLIHVTNASVPQIVCPSVVCQSPDTVEYCTTAACSAFTWQVQGGTVYGDTSSSCIGVVWDMPPTGGYGSVTLEVAACGAGICLLPTTVEVPVIPEIQPIIGPSSICNSNAQGVAYSVPYWPGATYSWHLTGPTGVTGTASGPNFLVNLTNFTDSFTLQVNITHPIAGCISTGKMVVHVNEYTIQVTSSLCYGADVALSVSPAPMPGPYQVIWQIPALSYTDTVADLPLHTIPFGVFGAGGSFIVQAIIILNSGQIFTCDALVSSFTIQDPVPPLTIAGPREICLGVTYTYKPVPLGGQISWFGIDGGNFVSKNNTQARVRWTDLTPPYTFSAVRIINGCPSDTATLDSVERITAPQIDFTGNLNPCVDGLETYISTADGAEPYFWSIDPPSAGSIIGANDTTQVTIQWHQIADTIVTLTLSANACGSVQTYGQNIHIHENDIHINCPTASGGDCRVCQHAAYVFTTDNADGATYEWFVDGVPVSGADADSLIYVFDQPGTHFVRVRMTGMPSCPGTFEDVIPVDVVPNPKPVISALAPLYCNELDTLVLVSTTYAGATTETFSWLPTGPAYYPDGPYLTIVSTNLSDYLPPFIVNIVRTIDSLQCPATDTLTLTCVDTMFLPHHNPNVIFSAWEFNNGVPCGNCRSAESRECGHIIVHGNLGGGMDFSDVEAAEWRVTDPNDGLNPVDEFPILFNSDLENTDISRFSIAGYYPAELRVKFYGDPLVYNDLRTLEIPLVPDFTWSLRCCDSLAGQYSLTLNNVSAQLPGAVIDSAIWFVQVAGGDSLEVSDTTGQLSLCLEPGSVVYACLTAYTTTVGSDNPGLLYYCTFCDTIVIPDAPTLAISADRHQACVGSAIHFTGEVAPASMVISYDWDFGDGSHSLINPTTKTYDMPGTYIVTLSVITDHGCELQAVDSVTILGNELGGHIEVMFDSCMATAALMYLPDSLSSLPVSWLWSPGGDTSEVIMVMISGSYDVTVADALGCLFSPQPVDISLPNLFFGGINGDLSICAGSVLSLSVAGTNDFDFSWTLFNADSSFIRVGHSRFATVVGVPAGSYTIVFYAYAEGTSRVCASISASVQVLPAPAPPVLHVDYDCDPFLAHLTANSTVAWSHLGSFWAFDDELWTGLGGAYNAVAVNQYGCKASANITVSSPIDASILAGCYEICDTLLKDSCILLPAPPGIYTYWAWIHDGEIVLKGKDAVTPLCLTEDLAGKIVLQIRQVYTSYNPPPAGSIDTCMTTSDTFCLTVLHCNPCPADLKASISNSVTPQCLMGGDDFNEQLVMVNMQLHLPAGYVFCDSLPVFDGAYLEYSTPPNYFNPPLNYLTLVGTLHVTDPAALMAGMHGYIQVCDRATGLMCPATFVMQPFTCGEELWCMFTKTVTYYTGTVSPYNQYAKMTFTFPAHYLEGKECDITSYTAVIWKASGTFDTISTTTFYGAFPLDTMYSVSFTILKKEIEKFGCVNFSFITNCGLGCECLYLCFNNSPGSCSTVRYEPGKRSTALLPQGGFSVRPNPAGDQVRLDYQFEASDGEGVVTVMNGLGQMISQIYLSDPKGATLLDTHDWPPGVYFLGLSVDGYVVENKKLIIQR